MRKTLCLPYGSQMTLLGDYIKERRMALQADNDGFSIRALSARIGIHHSYLSKLERGEHAPLSVDRIVALARELGVNEELLLAMGGRLPERISRLIKNDPQRYLQCLSELEGAEEGPKLTGSDYGASHEELVRRLQELEQEKLALEGKLRLSEGRWKAALQATQEGVWDWDAVTGRVFFSRRWKEMLGYAADEIGDDFNEWDSRIHPEDHDAVYTELNRHLRGEIPHYSNEHRLMCKNGSYKWILARGVVAERDEDGHPLRVIGTHLDTTARREAEETVRASETFLKTLMASIKDTITVLDLNLVIRFANGRTLALPRHGEEVLGLKCFEAFHNRAEPCVDCPSLRCLATGEPQSIVKSMRAEQGIRWIELSVYPIRNGEDAPLIGVVEVARDITDKKSDEDAQRESEERFRALFEKNPHVQMLLDPETGEIRSANETAAIYYGYSEKRMAGMSIHDISVQSEEVMREAIVLASEFRENIFDFQHCLANGQVRDVEISLSPIRVNKRLHLHCLVLDVTERKHNEKLLLRIAEEERMLLHSIETQIWYLLDADTYGLVNKARADFLGGGIEYFSHKRIEEFLPPERAARCKNGNRQVYETRMALQDECWVPNSEGELRLLRVVKSPKLDAEGNVEFVICVGTDITEQREAEELRREVDRLMRHDLKSPLNGIVVLPDLVLANPALSPVEREMLEGIRDSGKKMLGLIDASLSLYKLETGQYEVLPHEIVLFGEFRAIEKEIREECRRKNIIVRYVVGGKCYIDIAMVNDGPIIVGDATLVPFVLSNLMKNAAEAAPENSLVQVVIDQGDSLRISIHNQGTVPLAVRDSFFEKYATYGKKHGTGLGTYSARLMARAHGGDVTMETSEYHGTTVVVSLPQKSLLERFRV